MGEKCLEWVKKAYMNTFEEIGLGPEIVKAVSDLGYENPTEIQQKAIPYVLSSQTDLVALAQTGTGKTAAFSLPVLEKIDIDEKSVQCLVLCPTRELCLQITKDIEGFSKYMKKLDVIPVYGGTSIDKQIRDLKRGGQIVVGTPGRIIDLLKRKKLNIQNIRWLVLDEADEMLSMGFKDDLDTILSETPEERQTLLFSATMPREIASIAENYMHDPMEISVGKKNNASNNVKHEYYVVHARDRYNALKRIADMNPDIYGIVFCRTRKETKDVADQLMQDGYNADALHGDLSQAQRDQVMGKFRVKHLQILVATDVAARGLDVNDLTHVINYNLPDDIEVYIHRSGRTGRAGKNGVSIAIAHSREIGRVRDVERKVGQKFERKMVPGGKEICEKQLFNLVDKVENVEVNDDQIEEYLSVIYKKLEWLNREDLIKRFVSVEFNRFLSYYEDAPDLNVTVRDRNDRRNDRRGDRNDRNGRDRDRGNRGNFARFFLNLGNKDNLTAGKLIGIINEQPALRKIDIGKIDIMNNFSFFEVDKKHERDLLGALNGVDYEGSAISVEVARSKESNTGFGGRAKRRKRRMY